MTAPIALQLYTLRDALAQDFVGTIRKVAEMGYIGVETAKMYGESPQFAVQLFRDLGLQVSSAHSDMPLGDKKNQVLDTLSILGVHYCICPWLDPQNFLAVDSIKQVCEMLNAANAVIKAHGMTLAYHNHDFEFIRLPDGKLPFEYMLDYLEPDVNFEIDTYWVQTAGAEVVPLLQNLGNRAPLLHIKDGVAIKSEPMLAVGEGVMDFPAIVEASSPAWMIVELDRCATDMVEAVEKSYQFLISKGLAHGK